LQQCNYAFVFVLFFLYYYFFFLLLAALQNIKALNDFLALPCPALPCLSLVGALIVNIDKASLYKLTWVKVFKIHFFPIAWICSVTFALYSQRLAL